MLLLILKLVPTILSIINKLVAAAHDQQMIDAGKAEELATEHQKLGETLAKVHAAAQEATTAHQTVKDDSAFDQEFKRGA